MKAIVYQSNTGHTKKFAYMLGERTGLKVYDLEAAGRILDPGTKIIYMGWLMAGQVKGLKKAQKKYQIAAVCGVGMAAAGSQIEDIRKSNPIGEEVPVFSLQGGFEMDKLTGIYKLMMTCMKKAAGDKLKQKTDRTADEDAMLEMLLEGKDMVSSQQLDEIMEWFNRRD